MVIQTSQFFRGLSGYSGYSGKSGYSGYSGKSGFSGFSGKSGFSGSSGFSGYMSSWSLTDNFNINEYAIILDASLSADEKWSGIVRSGTAGATIASGDLCYLASSGKWLLSDGILNGTDTGFKSTIGICVLAANDTQTTNIFLFGVIRSAAFPAFTIGAPVYISDTAGDIQVAQPSTNDFAIRIVGYGMTAEDLFFNPSNDYIVHT